MMNKKWKLLIYLTTLLIFLLLAVKIGIQQWNYAEQAKDTEDGQALRKVIAEAYINIKEDPSFVNTATEDQPMEVPEKYYTYVKSVQGDGPVHVVVDPNYNVEAYFGTPEKTRGYYEDLCGDET